MPAILPGLEVKNLGSIGLPLAVKQAIELQEYCEQGPTAKERRPLSIPTSDEARAHEPKRVLTNPAWNDLVKDVVNEVQVELGLETQKLEAHLYDLLLYEPGSFFLPHKDGEKLDRMVATLVIVLPSPHEGGELVVRHDGQQEIIDFGSTSANPFEIHFAGFYANCEH